MISPDFFSSASAFCARGLPSLASLTMVPSIFLSASLMAFAAPTKAPLVHVFPCGQPTNALPDTSEAVNLCSLSWSPSTRASPLRSAVVRDWPEAIFFPMASAKLDCFAFCSWAAPMPPSTQAPMKAPCMARVSSDSLTRSPWTTFMRPMRFAIWRDCLISSLLRGWPARILPYSLPASSFLPAFSRARATTSAMGMIFSCPTKVPDMDPLRLASISLSWASVSAVCCLAAATAWAACAAFSASSRTSFCLASCFWSLAFSIQFFFSAVMNSFFCLDANQ